MGFDPCLELGQVVTTYDISKIFEVDPQQGIRTSQKHDYIVIVSDRTSKDYIDDWLDDYRINYTGAGRIGDQKLSGRNKTLADVNQDNKEIFFFEVEIKKEYIYRGKCHLIGTPFKSPELQKDINGNLRSVYKFPLELENKRRDFLLKETVKNVYDEDEAKYKIAYNDLTSKDIKVNAEFEYYGKPVKKQKPIIQDGIKVYIRNKTKSSNALKKANYECEYNSNHKSFMRKKIEIRYTEPHHLVPMEFSDLFDHSLDVEENIVSLCSDCHNLIHYGKDRFLLLEKLYDERKELLKSVGININFEEIKQMYK